MKYIIFSLFFVLFLNAYTQNQIVPELQLPSEAKAGDVFQVGLIIEKPDISSYAVFTQQFPKGFSVEEGSSGTAIFNFEKQKLSYTWIRLPDKKTITINYSVKLKSDLKGDYQLSGLFTYLVDNMKGTIPLDNFTIKISKKN